jgi:branched-chain amino acid transport system ATP-binding protein
MVSPERTGATSVVGSPILDVSMIRKTFAGLVALDGVSLQLGSSEILGLIGPNGAGKSTLFNIISGSMKPTAGKVKFHDLDITGLPPNRICKLGIARTFQIPRPFLDMTVLENVEIAQIFGGNRVPKIGTPREICELVGLRDKMHLSAKVLNVSGKKRLEVARALATSPEVLLLDEIAAGMAPAEGEWVIGFMEKMSREYGVSIIWVEHVMRLLMKGVDRVIVIDHGIKIAEGKPEDVVNDERVQQAYLGEKKK